MGGGQDTASSHSHLFQSPASDRLHLSHSHIFTRPLLIPVAFRMHLCPIAFMGHRKSICSLHHGRRKLRQEFVFHALHIRLFPEIVKLKGIRFSVIEIPRSHHIHLDVIRPLPQRPHLPALGPGVETVETVPLRRYRIFGRQRQSIVFVPILSGKSARS